MGAIEIDQESCTVCGSCIDVCVMRIFREDEDAIETRDESRCMYCGHCMAICPQDAIELPVVDCDEFEPVPEREELPRPEKLMGLFRTRRSIRRFQDKPVEREKIEKIIEAGRFAPTGGNSQLFRFVVLQSKEKIAELRDLMIESLMSQAERTKATLDERAKQGQSLSKSETMQLRYAELMRGMGQANKQGIDRLLWNAPALIALHAPPDAMRGAESMGVNAGLAGMQMTLMAESLGLGTCFIGFVPAVTTAVPDLKKVMEVPEDHKIVLAFVAGYSDYDFLKLVSRKPARIQWIS